MKFKKMFVVFAALAFLTGCCCKKSYNIAFLGDIHYDRAELHDGEVYKKFNPKVPLAKGVLNKDGLYSWRSQTNWVNESLGHNFASIKQNVKMWEKDTPMLLDNAAKTAKKYDARYLFQLGDIIQGDAGRYDLHNKIDAMPRSATVCHGDLNLTNVIVTEDGTAYVTGWAHTTRGDALADVAKTYLSFWLRGDISGAERYLEIYCDRTGTAKEHIDDRTKVIAAALTSRCSENEREFLLSLVNKN